MTAADRSHRGPWLALAAATLPILILTLTPGGTSSAEPLSVWCIVCGWRGASDGILNVALFVPFGLALGALGIRARTALLIGCLFSVGVELAQFLIPNRYPGLGDVIYNGTGATLGVLLFTWRLRLLAPVDRLQARRRTWAWGAAGLIGLVAQAWLLAPAIPERAHQLEWTPTTEWGAAYEGEVLRFSVDGVALPTGPVSDGGQFTTGLKRGVEMEVLVHAGPESSGIVPLVLLTDADGNDDLFLGLDNLDIVIQYRTNGMSLHLDRPLVRWPRGAARWAEGDTISLRFSGIGGGIVVDQSGGTAVDPFPPARGPRDLRVPTARGWGFLMYPRFAARRSGTLIDVLWMVLLAFPLGIWGAPRAAAVCAVAWMGVLVTLPVAAPLLSMSIPGALGVPAGMVLGLVARLVHGNPEPFMWWKPLHTIYDPEGRGRREDAAESGE